MKNFTLKNFRVFDSNGATFELSPMSILTGCNSSGKSSFTKSWILLQEFFQSLSADIKKDNLKDFNDYHVNFTHGNHKLGSFESVINWNSKTNEITIEYDVNVVSIYRCLNVSITFVPYQTLLQKRNQNDVFGKSKHLQNSTSKNAKSLFAAIKSVVISDSKWGILYEYHNDNSTQQSIFHICEEWHKRLVAMTHNLDFKVTVDDIINCRNAAHAGIYVSSEFTEFDMEHLLDTFGDENVNIIYNQWEKLREKAPNLYNNLISGHGFKNVERDESGKVIWEKLKHSHDADEYGFFYPMTFMRDLDKINKNDILKWVDDNIIEKSKDKWFDCDKFRERIYYIFNRFIQSKFDKFSDFWSFYESAVFKDYHSSFALIDLGENSVVAPHLGTAMKTSFRANPYEEDWNWDSISDATFFEEMFRCLNGFGGYYDSSMYGGPTISYPERDMLLQCAKTTCLEALASASDICNAQFVEIDRSNAQRLYTFDNRSTSFNDILEKYIETPKMIPILYGKKESMPGCFTEAISYKRGTFLKKWIKSLVDYDDIEFDLAPESVGVYVYLKKKVNGKTRLISLADVGYGTTPLIAMMIRIELMICQFLQQKGNKGVLCIEEPESNLHPNLQSRLAEMFADAIANYPIKVVLETHSEYLIRKLQTLVASKKVSSSDISIYYIGDPDPKKRSAGEPQIKCIKIKESGGLTAKFGTGFLDHATMLSAELFK